jgi:hypothetical protein
VAVVSVAVVATVAAAAAEAAAVATATVATVAAVVAVATVAAATATVATAAVAVAAGKTAQRPMGLNSRKVESGYYAPLAKHQKKGLRTALCSVSFARLVGSVAVRAFRNLLRSGSKEVVQLCSAGM